jgi:hypothetical protein
LRLFTKNVERLRIDTLGRVGIGTTTPAAPFDLRSTSSLLARFAGGSKMYMALYEGSSQRGYIGSFAGNAQDVDFGTNTINNSGRVHLTTLAIPRLSIDSIGRVGIGTTTPSAQLDVVNPTFVYGIRINNTRPNAFESYGLYASSVNAPGLGMGIYAIGGLYGIHAVAEAGNYPYSAMGVSGLARGIAGGAGDRYGVYGSVSGGRNAYGVFGTAGNALFNAAGYFGGDVWAYAYRNVSDRKFKQDIQPVKHGLEQVLKLKPSVYTFKTSEYKGMQLPKGRQIGLVADEIKEVFPELVSQAVHPAEYDKEDRTKIISPEVKYEGVNYQGLIPVLIASVQQLNEKDKEIDALKAEMAELRQMVLELKNNRTGTLTSNGAYLEQNSPNPVRGNTTIRYYVPETSISSHLTLTNAKGQVVKTISLGNRGTGQVNLSASILAAGTYTYTLWVDGKQSDSKQLVIAK